jgi:hypothetical protein
LIEVKGKEYRDMNKKRINIIVLSVLMGLVVVSFTGCVTTQFIEPLVSFQQSINQSSFIVADYYEHANAFERDIYFNDCLFNPEKELLVYDNGRSTPLLSATLSPESIKARADALVLIGIYADRLTELAGNDSSAVFYKNSIALGDNLQNLGKTFANLSESDASAMLYSGPILKLIGVLGKMYLENSKYDAITVAVHIGYPVVNRILNQLQNDLNNIIIPLQKTGLKQEVAEMSAYYNANRKKLPLTRRRTELARINKVIIEYNILLNSNPANLIQEMKQTNKALVKYVESSRTPEDFAEFVSILGGFNRNVQLFGEAIKHIR